MRGVDIKDELDGDAERLPQREVRLRSKREKRVGIAIIPPLSKQKYKIIMGLVLLAPKAREKGG